MSSFLTWIIFFRFQNHINRPRETNSNIRRSHLVSFSIWFGETVCPFLHWMCVFVAVSPRTLSKYLLRVTNKIMISVSSSHVAVIQYQHHHISRFIFSYYCYSRLEEFCEILKSLKYIHPRTAGSNNIRFQRDPLQGRKNIFT